AAGRRLAGRLVPWRTGGASLHAWVSPGIGRTPGGTSPPNCGSGFGNPGPSCASNLMRCQVFFVATGTAPELSTRVATMPSLTFHRPEFTYHSVIAGWRLLRKKA